MLAVALMALGSMTVSAAEASAAKRTFGQRALQQGMNGRDVRVLQDFLTRAGFILPSRIVLPTPIMLPPFAVVQDSSTVRVGVVDSQHP